MLSLENIVVHYGGVRALKSISMQIAEGSITCLIGSNGAGKSTTLRAISGMVPLTSGKIEFRGRRIDGLSPEEIVALGIGHVPEGKKLFLEMNVRDNLLSGAYLRRNTPRITADLKRVCEYFPVLGAAISRPASQMSGGEQQMLAIGRGLMSKPKLLLLDEPSLGLSPLLTQEVGKIIRRIADTGVSILLIEQNASLALSLSQKCYVLETGVIAIEGDSAELRNDPHVKAAYMGISANASRTQTPPPRSDAISGQPVVQLPPESPARQESSDRRKTEPSGAADLPAHHIQGRHLSEISLNLNTTPALVDPAPQQRYAASTGMKNTLPAYPLIRPRHGPARSVQVIKNVFRPMGGNI